MSVPIERKNSKTGEVTTVMYETVAERVKKAHEKAKGEIEIETTLLKLDEKIVVFKAVVTINKCSYTGHALEKFGSPFINKTSALENCETSSLGRALAAAGFLGSEFASADEVANAVINQKKPTPKLTEQDFEKIFEDDKWRDELVGYKAEAKRNLTWRTVSEDDLLWIVQNWKDKKPYAVKEHGLRAEEGEGNDGDFGEGNDAVETNIKPEEIPF